MTTAVIVKANHGWPVKVTYVQKLQDGSEARTEAMVPANSEQTFYVWDGQDILVHEIQPNEIADANAARIDPA